MLSSSDFYRKIKKIFKSNFKFESLELLVTDIEKQIAENAKINGISLQNENTAHQCTAVSSCGDLLAIATNRRLVAIFKPDIEGFIDLNLI